MAVTNFTCDEVAAATGGRVVQPATAPVAGLSLDSRAVKPGNLFAALKGSRADGHDFLEAAARAGAAVVLVEREVPLPTGVGAVRVKSVEGALKDLGRAVRNAFRGEVVGVVGSCGKTTTKDFIAAALALAGTVHATAGNRNNLLGLPETLMEADADARFWVLEMGISRPLEMEELAPIASPTGVVFTTIQPVHMEFFPSLEAIRDEKAKVLRWTRPGGWAALNADDPLLKGLALPGGVARLTYGRGDGAGLWIEAGGSGPQGTSFALRRGGERAEGFLPVAGAHNLINYCAACAAGLHYGIPLKDLAGVAEALRPALHRGQALELRDRILLLDDSYNSNPAALASVLASVSGWGRRTMAVLGEMLELGPQGPTDHEAAGRLAADAGVQCLLAVGGDNAGLLAEAFAASGRPALHVARWADGAGWFEAHLRPADAVLVKGSRGIALDGMVRWLAERRSA